MNPRNPSLGIIRKIIVVKTNKGFFRQIFGTNERSVTTVNPITNKHHSLYSEIACAETQSRDKEHHFRFTSSKQVVDLPVRSAFWASQKQL